MQSSLGHERIDTNTRRKTHAHAILMEPIITIEESEAEDMWWELYKWRNYVYDIIYIDDQKRRGGVKAPTYVGNDSLICFFSDG